MSGEAFNRLVRTAAGRDVHLEREPERPVGDLGGGKGGCCAVPQPRPTSMNDRIRSGMMLTRHAAIGGGIRIDGDVDLDDLLGRR